MADQITKDLGGITAYAAAVAAGYTGTKSQFETLMASYATVAQNAAASATAANGSAEDAEAYAVGTRDGSDVGSTDPAYHNNSKYYAELAEDFADSIDPDTLAKVDGYYDEMSVGNADQLLSSVRETDTEPYGFRTAGGATDIGDRVDFALVGVDVGWNQLIKNGNFTNTNDWTATNGTLTVSGNIGTFSSSSSSNKALSAFANIIKDHKYILAFDYKSTNDFSLQRVNGSEVVPSASAFTNKSIIQVAGSTTQRQLIWYDYSGSASWELQLKNVVCIDLTQMLGSTVADYIYSLEQATAGSGVTFFRKYVPKSFYEHNTGSLESANPTAHKTTGFNQWDEEWESGIYGTVSGNKGVNANYIRNASPIRVVPNTTYYLKFNAVEFVALFYDADKNYTGIYIPKSSSGTIAIPPNAEYMNFYVKNTTYANDICINLHWDGSRDGEYEAYKEHTYEIEPYELHGIMKLEDGKLKADGDIRHADGSVDVRYVCVDLGTLTYSTPTSSGRFFSQPPILGKSVSGKANIFCPKYPNVLTRSGWYNADSGDGISITGAGYGGDGYIGFVDASFAEKTSEEVATALNGIYVVYERATPTEDTAEPFTSPQIVDDFGTEEFIDYDVEEGNRDVVVPVGHISEYPANLKAKLEMQPDNPGEANDYVVSHANGTNSYVPLGGTDTITGIIARLEALENAAGIGGE